MIALLAIALLAQAPDCPRTGDRACGTRTGGRSSGGSAMLPQFSFATVAGAGMTAECAGTALTGTKGEAITFTRASAGYCTAGNVLTGLSNSSMTLLTTDQPRAMKGGNGAGGIGLLGEPAHTNNALRSSEFDNAAWTKFGSGAAAPVVIANAGTAPDGTLTADLVHFAAVTSLQISDLLQAAGAAATRCQSVYAKGYYDGGLADGGADDGGTQWGELMLSNFAVGNPTVRCPIVSGSWTRCIEENVTTSGTNFGIGPQSLNGAGVDLPQQSIYLWGADVQFTDACYSYTATTSAAATTAAEIATASYTAAGSTLTMSCTVEAGSLSEASATPLQLYQASTDQTFAFFTTTTATPSLTARWRIGGANSDKVGGTLTASAANLLAWYYNGTQRASCVAGTCAATVGALTLPTGASTIYLGGRQAGAGFELGGVVKNVCVDPTLCASYGQ